MIFSKTSHVLCGCALWFVSSLSLATVVQIETSEGNILINLFDETTPATVSNFLSYVTDGSYDDGLFHRVIPGFVVQSGGSYFTDPNDVETSLPITSKGSVINEPIYSSVEGTIAMAKLGGDPDSATSEWFININNNSCNLDLQNGGFTVFGQVISGMEFMPAIAESQVLKTDFVAVTTIKVTNPAVDTTELLVAEPVLNTLINGEANTTLSCESSLTDSGGGSMPVWLLLLTLTTLTSRKQLSI